MKFKILVPYLLLLMMVSKIKAQQSINIANESEINTSFQEYSPAFYKGGLVFITSNPTVAKIKQSDENTGKGTTSIFFSKQLENGLLSKPTPFAESLTTSFYDGPLCFNPNGTTVYFTRSNIKNNKPIKAKDGLVKLKIFAAQLKGEKWADIVELPFNNKEFDFTHPSVSPDGRRLYFASNRPGGFGGMDLYVSTLIDNKWSEPVNLGPKINTSKDEIFPFIHADGKVYYSSNGRAKNIGGLDVYFTAKTDTGWLQPKLLPEPINSRSDDFGLILSPDKLSGYFSSNRSSGEGDDDIYSFIASQTIDSEFITNNELSNNDESESKSNDMASVEPAIGEVKSIEKTNVLVDSEKPQQKSDNDSISEVQNQIGQAKSELQKLENPIIESAKSDVFETEVPVEKSKEETPATTPKIEPTKEVVAIKEEVKTDVPVEKTKEETPAITPKIEPTKEVVAIKEEVKTDVPVEKTKEETPVITPKIEPIKEVVAIKEEVKTDVPVEKLKEETPVITPKIEPTKEVAAIKEEVKTDVPVEKLKEETPVITPKIEPIKEIAAIKEEVKTEVPVEKTKEETPVITPKIEPTKEVAAIKEEVKIETTPSVSALVLDKKIENTSVSDKETDAVAKIKKETSGTVRCKYLVVVGTYADEKNAIIQQKIVKNKGFADVEVIHYKDRNLYGVCVKQSNDEKEAYSVAKTVVKGGINAFVKVLK
jgi:WD40-like Beta Propeller Repeat